jgi:hypothetical protein
MKFSGGQIGDGSATAGNATNTRTQNRKWSDESEMTTNDKFTTKLEEFVDKLGLRCTTSLENKFERLTCEMCAFLLGRTWPNGSGSSVSE